MKKYLLLASLVLSAVFTASSPAEDAARASAETLLSFGSNVFARTGMSRDQLVAQLGAPSEKLGEDVWAYWDFRAAGLPPATRGDTLVVVFTQGHVSLLRVTDRASVEAALAKLRANAAKSPVIAKK